LLGVLGLLGVLDVGVFGLLGVLGLLGDLDVGVLGVFGYLGVLGVLGVLGIGLKIVELLGIRATFDPLWRGFVRWRGSAVRDGGGRIVVLRRRCTRFSRVFAVITSR